MLFMHRSPDKRKKMLTHGDDSNDATCAVVRVICKIMLSSEYMVDGRRCNTSDFAVVRVMIRLSIYSDDSKILHVMIYK